MVFFRRRHSVHPFQPVAPSRLETFQHCLLQKEGRLRPPHHRFRPRERARRRQQRQSQDVWVSVTRSWSYKQNLSINLCYAHFRALLLVAILEQPIRMLRNKCSIILCWKYLYRIGPCFQSFIYSGQCYKTVLEGILHVLNMKKYKKVYSDAC